MKFYTLDFDCNAPVTQQVNVPTNTDYKVGIKVKRNGAYQNLKPAEVTLGTLSADEGDVNGYTTFTMSTGDDASYTQATLDIQHGYEAGYVKPAFVEHNTTGASQTVTIVEADLSDFVGQTLKPEDINYAALGASRAALTINDIEANFGPYWRDNDASTAAVQFKPFIEDKDGNTKMWLIVSKAIREHYCNALGWPLDKPGFFITDPSDPTQYAIVETYTVQEGDKLVMGKGLVVSNDRYYGGKISITAGTPFSASFKLNTNVFKSQQGDIGGAAASQTTVNISGKFSDNTDFSYDFVVA